MEVRQYIGARYVPKFFENPNNTSEWLPNTIYEPLTIVTYGQNSYTSKKTVPASVGDPSNNPEYWVATGNMNAFIEEIQGDIEGIQGDIEGIQGDIETIQGNIEDIQGDIEDIQGDITDIQEDIENIDAHYYLLVTDSYGDPTAVDGGVTWEDYFANIVGVTNCYKAYKGGYGFAPSYNAPFIRLITPGSVDTGVPVDFDTTKVTDIVVLGGFNDRAVAVSDIKSAISAFCTYARTTYVNLKNIYIGACGWSMNSEHLATLAHGRYVKAYSECGEYGALYLNGIENTLHDFGLYTEDSNDSLLLGKQYVHPNAAGSKRLAINAINAIKNGCCTVQNDFIVCRQTFESGIDVGGASTIVLAEYMHNNIIHIELSANNIHGSFSIGQGATTINLAKISTGYFNANDGAIISCRCFVAGGDYSTNTPMDACFMIKDGYLKIWLLGNASENTTKTATNIFVYPCDGNVDSLNT